MLQQPIFSLPSQSLYVTLLARFLHPQEFFIFKDVPFFYFEVHTIRFTRSHMLVVRVHVTDHSDVDCGGNMPVVPHRILVNIQLHVVLTWRRLPKWERLK